MIPRLALGVATGLALALAGAADVTAQPADVNAARAHYKAAETAEREGRYAEAATEYGIAYDLTKDPILFFKIGVVNEKAGKCGVALTYFQRYLREGNPTAEFRRLTDEKIAACRAATGPGGATGGAGGGAAGGGDGGAGGTGGGNTGDGGTGGGTTGDGGGGVEPDFGGGADGGETGAGGELGAGGPSFVDGGTTWKRSAAWISTGATVGLLAVGAVLYMSAEGSEEDLEALIDFRDPSTGRPLPYREVASQYQDLVDEGERFDALATYAFVAAGVTAAAAVTFFILDGMDGGREKPVGFVGKAVPRVTPRLGRETAGVVLGWEF